MLMIFTSRNTSKLFQQNHFCGKSLIIHHPIVQAGHTLSIMTYPSMIVTLSADQVSGCSISSSCVTILGLMYQKSFEQHIEAYL